MTTLTVDENKAHTAYHWLGHKKGAGAVGAVELRASWQIRN